MKKETVKKLNTSASPITLNQYEVIRKGSRILVQRPGRGELGDIGHCRYDRHRLERNCYAWIGKYRKPSVEAVFTLKQVKQFKAAWDASKILRKLGAADHVIAFDADTLFKNYEVTMSDTKIQVGCQSFNEATLNRIVSLCA